MKSYLTSVVIRQLPAKTIRPHHHHHHPPPVGRCFGLNVGVDAEGRARGYFSRQGSINRVESAFLISRLTASEV